MATVTATPPGAKPLSLRQQTGATVMRTRCGPGRKATLDAAFAWVVERRATSENSFPRFAFFRSDIFKLGRGWG